MNYAKYSDPDQLQRDAQETIRVTCDTEIIHYYFGNKEISFFLAATLLIPFITTSSLSLYIRTHRETIVRKIRKGSNHRNMASLVLTGFCVMIYVVVMDVAAVITVFSNNHEYSEFELTYSLNLQLVTSLLYLMSFLLFTLFLLHGTLHQIRRAAIAAYAILLENLAKLVLESARDISMLLFSAFYLDIRREMTSSS